MNQKSGDPGSNSYENTHEDRQSDRDPAPDDTAETENGSEFKSASRLPGRRRFDRMAVSPTSGAGGAYQGAMEAVLAVVVATLLGYWADSHFGTEPLWLIVGAIIGFASMVLRLLRMARLIEEPEMGERVGERVGEQAGEDATRPSGDEPD